MAAPRPSKTHIGNHALRPETLMLGYGYDPALSEGAVKPPVFLTSTFVFRSAEEGRDFFDYVSGRKKPPEGSAAGLVYSRFNHPNSEIVEDRLAIYEGAESGVLFSSGMSAITTTILAFARPGDVILHSQPLYGGTETLLSRTMAKLRHRRRRLCRRRQRARRSRRRARGARQRPGIAHPDRDAGQSDQYAGRYQAAAADRRRDRSGPGLPAHPGLRQHPAGPVFQHPLAHGADVSVYSLTKYVGGHSDLIAGATLGSKATIGPIKALRGSVGTQLDPYSCWMLGRSLETLALRMERANTNARLVAEFLRDHAKVGKVHHLAFLEDGSPAQAVFARQCSGAGSTFSFDIKGGEKEAFAFLNALEVFKLAVSLGGTELLASHPAAMTHSGVPAEVRDRIGVLDTTIRLSVGIEHPDDLIADLAQALAVTA